MGADAKRSNGEGTIYRIKGRGGYRAQVTLLDGSRPSKQCRTVQEARDWIAQQRSLDRMGERRATSTTTVDEWAATWFTTRAGHVAPKTLANEWSHYGRYFAPLAKRRLEHLTSGQIQDWLASIERRSRAAKPGFGQPHTVRICFSLLSVMLRDALSHELLAANPMVGLKRPRVPPPTPKFLTRDEVTRFLDEVDSTGDSRALAVHLMLRLGLRRNEALGITWGDLDLEHATLDLVFQLGRITLPGSEGGTALVRRELKTVASRRQLRIAGDLAERLRRQRGSLVDPIPTRFVVTLDDGLPVDPDALSHWVKSVGRRIGIVVTPHRLRHTSATLMLNRGVSMEAVGKVLGHTDIKTTGVYARVLDETGTAALETLASDLDSGDAG